MCSFAEKDLNVYSLKWMKIRTIIPEFSLFTNETGLSNVVYITDMTSTILSEQWYKDRTNNFNDEKVGIITARQI